MIQLKIAQIHPDLFTGSFALVLDSLSKLPSSSALCCQKKSHDQSVQFLIGSTIYVRYMRSIRWKLFLNVGVILLVMAALNYFLPKFFVTKDLKSASDTLLDKFGRLQTKIEQTITLWVSSYFVGQASQLEAFSKIIATSVDPNQQKESLWVRGADLISFNPSLAYVQIEDEQGTIATIAPENGKLYAPSWTALGEQLLLRLSETDFYLAFKEPSHSTEEGDLYFLYTIDQSEVFKTLDFKSFENPRPTLSFQNPEELYRYMQWEQNQQLIRAQMMSALAPFQGADAESEKPVGALTVNHDFKTGYALFADEVFLAHPEIGESPSAGPKIVARQNDLDLAYFISVPPYKAWLAFSLSRLAERLSDALRYPLILSDGNELAILFQPDTTPVPLSGDFSGEEGYQPKTFSLGPLTISLLIPTQEVNAIPNLMNQLHQTVIDKISYNLFFAALVILVIAIVLLARISKRITRPITQLAQASEEIGRGKYDELLLPKVEKREDEIAVLTHSFEGMVVALRDRETIRGVLNKVVSKEVASEILKSAVELGGEERYLTLLFSDIRNFTPLSNQMRPQEVVEMLNDYMTHMCEVIDKTQGVVDKFVGDEIMALYGAPLALDDHAERAVEAAIQMMKALHVWNQNRQAEGKRTLEIGIGIHTGTVCSGNMGAKNRLNYTVIGSNVNLASRLCSAAKPMQILISKETKEELPHPESFPLQKLPPLSVKGFEKPISLFEISREQGI